MKHIFIINPQAGRGGADHWLVERITSAFADAPQLFEIYITTHAGDGTNHVTRRCQDHTEGEELCFYGCGGDGTLNEVATAILDYPFASLGVIPCGTGNDFIKNFPGHDFMDLAAQRAGCTATLDLISCNGRVAINICNAGLDADVARDITMFKRLPFCGGSMAYIVSLCKNFFGKLGQWGTVCCDGTPDPPRELLVLVVANGSFYGGSFCGAPHAQVDDGLLDVVIVPKISHLKILGVLPRYQKGRHTVDGDLIELVAYRKCRQIFVTYARPITLCIDGDTMVVQSVEAHILPGALRVRLPAPAVAPIGNSCQQAAYS